MSRISRRRFLEDAMLTTAAAVAAADGAEQVLADEKPSSSANERLNVAVIGVRGRGRAHAAAFDARKDCQLTYICDCDKAIGPKVADRFDGKPKCVEDMRHIFDDKSVDIVTIATPNHWHSLAAIWAMQAGKDVYVEKPVSHNISEGRRMVQVAEKHKRICQGGTQYRSHFTNRAAAQYIKEGKLGQIKIAHCFTYRPRLQMGPLGAYEVPKTVDYNLWAGPAPMQIPVTRPHFHYDWHWIWKYGNGELGNNSVHCVDGMRMILDLKGLGRGVISYGGRQFDDAGETPNTQVTIHDYGELTVVQEVRNLKTGKPRFGASVLITGAEGYIAGTLGGNTVFDLEGKMVEKLTGPVEDHFANFVKAVRSRKMEDLNAPIAQTSMSTAVVHVGNVSQLLGNRASPEEIVRQLEKVKSNENAVETFAAIRQHLADNDVDLQKDQLILGPWLKIDSDKERFIDSPAADTYLTREYREPFVVPSAEAI